ncbi:MAG: MotA/TolQ/ExbB proton channel family protein [Kiritimatiellae bacterium]|nr:MotA/TolQ/ExbB proton channel family protein [Kiritimatiellia bacterium]
MSQLSFALPLAGILHGLFTSSGMGIVIVFIQIVISIVGVSYWIHLHRRIKRIDMDNRRFVAIFRREGDVLDYCLQRHPGGLKVSMETIYNHTCERMLKLLSPERRTMVAGQRANGTAVALTKKEMGLVRSSCMNTLEEEIKKLEAGLWMLATIVTTAPMLGLLGTVWGVMDAFDMMGGKGTVLLSEIAPAISAALGTTVVGLIVGIPAVCVYNYYATRMKDLTTDMESFCEELLGRIKMDYQGGEE